MWVRVYVSTIKRELKRELVIGLETLPVVILTVQSVEAHCFGVQKFSGTDSANLRIFRLSPNPRRRAFTIANIYPRRRRCTVLRICVFAECSFLL